MNAPETFSQLLGRPEYAWLIDRLVARIEQGRPLDSGSATFNNPSESQRRAIDDLLGRRSTRGKTLAVDLADLTDRLGLSSADLAGIVTTLRGPVENRRSLREADQASWHDLFARWRERLGKHPPLVSWLDELQSSGYLKKAGGGGSETADRLLSRMFRILVEDAPHDDILLASLAAAVTGDSHALDRGQPLAHLCLGGIRHLHGIDGTEDSDTRREAWSALGVLVDDLSAPVLCLNLPPAPESDPAPWIDWHLERGEPFYLSWRQAREFTIRDKCGPVFVCENPAVVSEAARRLGRQSAPLVCFYGVPSGAVRVLLRRLIETGIELRMSADFDWAGLRILDPWISGFPETRPWRMSATDYRCCHPVKPLAGIPFRPFWARDLVEGLDRTGLAAFEEERIDSLLADLSSAD